MVSMWCKPLRILCHCLMAPGVREKDGKPHAVRLYPIASSRYGGDMTGKSKVEFYPGNHVAETSAHL